MKAPRITLRLWLVLLLVGTLWTASLSYRVGQWPTWNNLPGFFTVVDNEYKRMVLSPYFLGIHAIVLSAGFWWVCRPGAAALEDGERVAVSLMLLGSIVGLLILLGRVVF